MSSYAILAETTAFPKEGQALPQSVFSWIKTRLAARRGRAQQRDLAGQWAAMEPRLLADLDIDPNSLATNEISLCSMNPMVLAVSSLCGTRKA